MINRSTYIWCFIFVFSWLLNSNIKAQIETDAIYTTQTSYSPSDPVFIFENLLLNPNLRYTAADQSESYEFEWYRHNSDTNTWDQLLQTQTGAFTVIIVNQPGGYLLRVNQNGNMVEEYRCWVFETEIANPEIVIDFQDCFSLELSATSESIPLTYYDPSTGNPGTVSIEKTYQWSVNPSIEFTQFGASIEMNAPVEDTQITVTISDVTGKSVSEYLDYHAIAVRAHYDWDVMRPRTSDDEKSNEMHRGEDTSIAEGSAPIEIRFEEKSSGPVSRWAWQIAGPSDTIAFRDRNPFYVFQRAGEYKVYLTVYNDHVFLEGISECWHRTPDPNTVNVMESLLEVPNTFTPNDDGINDEFRVAFRSIRKFNMVIYNRWGRRVYSSSNPSEGWDGTIGGKRAAPGVYFYHIEAEGYNANEKYKLSGPVHLIR
ncbi:gliding motility-associated C-terminal domain-containing protein [Natronoflexus pectinivorans]|uniref:Gliding motility-associated-like protein n=1 Tax=Natronoflexus pectinivorans TaxID=682526 RepID=A0A4R2GN75_9BACT|nr:gliding motility-associated C-terminal domain-containing protein [Natronoflexus pectinivorans]TCO10448.1 gliding motility-associated-like protein [Natronoflexus pectinivorans]